MDIINCISILLAILSAIISFYVYTENTHRKNLKHKILAYIFEFFAPSYIVDKTTTTKMIYNKFKSVFVKEQDILSCLLELNAEDKIQLDYTLSSTLYEIHWMSNVKKQK